MKTPASHFLSNSPGRFSRPAIAALALWLASTALSHSQSLSLNSTVGYPGIGSADGSTSNAQFNLPAGTARDAAGNIYVADSGNNTIRKITPAGQVSTIAGFPGVSGSTDGTGTNALFSQPHGIAVDAATNLYVADSGNNTIRKISASGLVSTLAGTAGVIGNTDGVGTNAFFSQPQAVAVDSATNLYVADFGNNTIRKITPGGSVVTLAGNPATNGSLDAVGTNALFSQPQGIAVDALQNVYVADTANATIRKITAAGVVTTLAGSAGINGSVNATGTNASFNQPLGIALDNSTNLYVADSFNNTIRKVTPAGVVTQLAGGVGTNGSADGLGAHARFWGPSGVAADAVGNIFVADYFNGTIRKVTSAGLVTTFAGSPSIGSVDGPAQVARFNVPLGAAVDTLSNTYVADAANSTIRKITASGQVTTFAGSPGVFGFADGAGTNALFNSPQAVAVDAANNVYVADTMNNLIRKITSSGVVTTLAGTVAVAGVADGIGTNAQFSKPQGLIVDHAGNIFVADTMNFTIRKISAGNVVTTLAGIAGTYGSVDGAGITALFNWPKGLALDTATNLYVADCLNHTIRQVTPSGIVTTLAGLAGSYGSADGTNTDARFFQPSGVAVDASGNVLVADTGNHTIRRITRADADWVVTTAAGLSGVIGSSNGTGTNALFDFPSGIALDASGEAYVADSANNAIRLEAVIVPQLVIANVTTVARRNSAIISWTTSLDASSQIQYGLTTNYELSTPVDPTLINDHATLLVGLQTNSTYFYQITSSHGEVAATNTGSFSTDVSIIVQNSQATFTGNWFSDSSGADRFSATYKYANTVVGADTAQAVFLPTIVLPANYDVSIWYSEGADRSAAAPVTSTYDGGSAVTTVNETVPGGTWTLVAANEPFAAGTNGFATLGNGTGETDKIVIADALRWTYSAGQDLPVNGAPPAWWTTFYFGGPVAGSQLGANGQSLLTDYILGISPTDAATTFKFGIRQMTNGFQAVFSPCYTGGRIYQLQATTSLLAPAWTNVPGLTAITNGSGQGMLSLTNVSAPAAFYRLSVQLTP